MRSLTILLGFVGALGLLSSCGPTCEVDCGANGACVVEADLATCSCDDGLAWDGTTCCTDGDSDGTCDVDDNCAIDANPDQADFNEDGIGDACDTIVIPIASLDTTASFFDYTSADGVLIKYFAVLGDTGAPHVAFDACDVCYGAHKGYRQEGDEMVCNNCGNRFGIDGLGTENQGGGCWPGYLVVTVTGTDVLIEPEALEAGAWYFR